MVLGAHRTTANRSPSARRYARPVALRVAFIAAECEPFAKTGGLADVVDALARALGQIGLGAELAQPVDVFLPRYRGIEVPIDAPRRRIAVPDPLFGIDGVTTLSVVDVEADGYRLRLVDHAAAFDRGGYYGDARRGCPDNAWRFGLFCRAALETLRSEVPAVDLIHLHDWHTGPATLYRDGPLRDDPVIGRAAMLLTVHNLAYRGWTPADRLHQLGLRGDPRLLRAGIEGLDLLRTGLERVELANTVSPGYAAEVRTEEGGMGLDELLRD